MEHAYLKRAALIIGLPIIFQDIYMVVTYSDLESGKGAIWGLSALCLGIAFLFAMLFKSASKNVQYFVYAVLSFLVVVASYFFVQIANMT